MIGAAGFSIHSASSSMFSTSDEISWSGSLSSSSVSSSKIRLDRILTIILFRVLVHLIDYISYF